MSENAENVKAETTQNEAVDAKSAESVEKPEKFEEEEEKIDYTPKYDPTIGDVYIHPVPPAKILQKTEVEICPICGFPKCYCKFAKSKHEKYDQKMGIKHPKEDEEKNANEGTGKQEMPQSDGKAADDSFDIPPSVGIDEAIEKEEQLKKGKPLPKVVISVKMRNKRKSTTTISGLQKRGIDMKDLAKQVAKKMCAAAAMKEKASEEVIVFQGDASPQLISLIKKVANVTDQDIQVVRKKKDPKPAHPQ